MKPFQVFRSRIVVDLISEHDTEEQAFEVLDVGDHVNGSSEGPWTLMSDGGTDYPPQEVKDAIDLWLLNQYKQRKV